MDVRILLQEEGFLVVDKPAGLPSQATPDPSRRHLIPAVHALLGETLPLTLVHRLDADTSGLLVLCADPSLNGWFTDLFRERRAHKTYRAMVGLPPCVSAQDLPEMMDDHLAPVPGSKPKKMQVVRAGGQRAHTSVRVLEHWPRCLTLHLEPRTGRTHQLRVQLASRNYPILGDRLYGQRERSAPFAPRLMLHAERLRFPHPSGTGEVDVMSAAPEVFLADYLRA